MEAPPVGTPNIDRECWEVHNLVRQNPKSLIPDLEEMLTRFKGKFITDNDGIRIQTKEGPKAVQEAIDFLKAAKPLLPLGWKNGLKNATKDHTEDTGPKGITGHDGSDRSKSIDRIKRYGKMGFGGGENISYG